MPRTSKKKRFVSEAEEAAWWEANGEAVAGEFEKALNEGYVGPCNLVVTGDSTATRVRLGSRDVAKGRAQAAKCGLRFQAYLNKIAHEALSNAVRNVEPLQNR
jgi:hypothetical protein